MGEFKMPSLGADMEEGVLVEWFVGPGDEVEQGQIIASVETQKGIIEVEVFESGLIQAILVQPGELVATGKPLAVIGNGQLGSEDPRPTLPPRARISPAARRLAEELEVDLSQLKGTGPDGAITREDVARTRPYTERPTGMRQAIAAAMTRSAREIPHYYLELEVDLEPTVRWLEAQNKSRSIAERLMLPALFVKATATALEKVPEFNGTWEDGVFRPGMGVHVGMAISLRTGGLVAPAILDADKKPPDEIMRTLTDLVARARSGRLTASELGQATATITNLGDRGVDRVFGIIHPPQVALVGFGQVRSRPVVDDEGKLVVHPSVALTLSADHRASDGNRGGLFLRTIANTLQTPETT